jgi:hypothetical protein
VAVNAVQQGNEHGVVAQVDPAQLAMVMNGPPFMIVPLGSDDYRTYPLEGPMAARKTAYAGLSLTISRLVRAMVAP